MRPYLSVILTLLSIIIAAAVPSAYGQFNVLYNFGSVSGDGYGPVYSGIIAQGRDGNLYSTTISGGANGNGAIFKITPAGTETVVYSFDGTTHGSGPRGGLTLGTDGNFYGTAVSGGANTLGNVFKITPSGSITILHDFTGGSDGATPYAPPIQGTDGNLYGTTTAGGNSGACNGGCGTIYKLTLSGTFTPLYQFDNAHGDTPQAPLVQGTDGNFYGTTAYGGAGQACSFGCGTVFKVTPSGKLSVLYNFDNTNGGGSSSPLIQGSDGNFYGTTQLGGSSNAGVVFKMTPAGVVSVFHDMNPSTDEETPYAGLVQANDGDFYGANSPNSGMVGTFFNITPKGALSVLHSFDGTTGASPQVTPFQDTNGLIYGDTSSGGTGNMSPCPTPGTCGVFYSWSSASLPAFIRLQSYSGKVGSKVGILGQGFSASSVVKFNGVQATTAVLTGTTFILATVPTGASSGFVTVTTGVTTLKGLQTFIVHNSWGSGAPMPTAVKSPATGVIGNQIYVVGGYTGSVVVADNQIYNPLTKAWSTGAALPATNYGAASAVVKNILYVIGGTPDGTTVTSNVWAYDPKKNTWTAKAAMPTARVAQAAAVENNIIYVIGGQDASFNDLATVESYNPATDTWTEEAPLALAKSFPAVGLLGSTIVAGDGRSISGDTGDNEGYTASTNTWKSLTADPTGRDGSCVGSITGQLYVAGGRVVGGAGTPALTLTESFNLTKWTTLAPLPQGTQSPGSAVSGNLLYCFGGAAVQAGNAINNVQIYQP